MTVRYTAAPYGRVVTLYKSEKAFQRAAKASDTDPATLALGVCFDGPEGPILRVRDGDPLTLLHECTHAALNILGHVGIDPREAGGEPMAYLLEHMYAHLLPHLSPASRRVSRRPGGYTEPASAGPCAP